MKAETIMEGPVTADMIKSASGPYKMPVVEVGCTTESATEWEKFLGQLPEGIAAYLRRNYGPTSERRW